MSFTAFILIVLSAVLHATWNLLAKKDKMTLAFYAIITSIGFLICLPMQFLSPVHIYSLPAGYWFNLFGSILCDSLLYSVGLMLVYRRMEMATAYPIMRALPIILTTVITTLFGLGSIPKPMAWIGFMIVFIGAIMMPLNKFSDFKPRQYFRVDFLFVLMAACGTTGYTVFDSQALKVLTAAAPDVSAAIRSCTYYSCREIALASMMWFLVLISAERRHQAMEIIRKHDWMPVLAGISAVSTYILVLIAMNFVNNVSYVQVFRQLGLPVGMLAGCIILKERAALPKWIGVSLILLGLTVASL